MARGFDSKAVESQQADADAARRPTAPAISPAEAARLSARQTLQLTRARALADLQLACAAPHRAMLEHAIADLDARLQQLDPPAH